MSKFPTEKHLASWGGMSPGNNESAGKKKTGIDYLDKRKQGKNPEALYQQIKPTWV